MWKTQLSGDDTVHFLCLKRMRTTGLNSDLNQYKDKITELLREFKQRFQIFDQLETDFQVFFSPFTLNASDLSVDLQLGIIDLQCDSNMKTKFALTSLGTFYQYLFPGYQWRSQPKNCGCGKMFGFRRITLFCLEKRLLSTKWLHSKNLGGMAPLPPGYAYAGYPEVTFLATKVWCMFRTTYLCQQVFSVMNIDKTKLRSTLT